MIRNRRRGKRFEGAFIIYISRPVRIFLRRFSLLALIVLSFLLIMTNKDEGSYSYRVKMAITDFVTPVVEIVTIPIDAFVRFNTSVGDYFFVYEKNAALSEENEKLKRHLSYVSQVMSENYKLYELLNFIEDSGYDYVSARVVGDASGPFVRSVLINAGSKDGIKKGQAVINEEGLVGRVIEVGKRSSRVLLITDINSRIPVVTNVSREHSILAGNNNEYPGLKYLANDTKVLEGEYVVTSGDGDIFPPGLKVGATFKASSGGFSVKPHVGLNRLEFVSVLYYKD